MEYRVESDDDSGIEAINNLKRNGSTSSHSDEDQIYASKSANLPNSERKHRVRFDDELHLSEQNMRKSCRKLFATLFQQNRENCEEISVDSHHECHHNENELLPSCHCRQFTQTLPHRKPKNPLGSVAANSRSHLNLNNISVHHNQAVDGFNHINQSFNNVKQFDKRLINSSTNNVNSYSCNEAFSRINGMSDRLESSSMVKAFARPVLIESNNTNTKKDLSSIYETIYPVNKDNGDGLYSSDIQINKWLNQDTPSKQNVIENKEENLHREQKSNTLKSRKSILKPKLSNVNHNNIGLDLVDSAMICADQVYPEECNNIPPSDGESPVCKADKSQRFSNSYSAGDVMLGINGKTIKSCISETNLVETEVQTRSLLQRFKSAINRAFHSEKGNLSMKNSKTMSQMDLNVSTNPKGSHKSARITPSDSFIRDIKTRVSLKKGSKLSTFSQHIGVYDQSRDGDNQVFGELITLNSDSSQIVQIRRQKGNPFGFFLARGTVNNVKGVFVSRMKDQRVQKSLVGILEIGDEIISIDGVSVKDANIMHVNQLISNKLIIRLKINPYMSTKSF